MKTLVLKVALQWDRKTWRTVELLESQTLADLHRVIQQAFDWDDDHLYAFFLTNKAWDRQGAYGGPHVEDMPRAAKAQLGQLGLSLKGKFLYIFDFGSELRHVITVVSFGTQDETAKYPRILEVHGEAPAQYGDE